MTEVGAALRSYGVGDDEVVDGFHVSERASGGRGQLLIPWPNRLEDGTFTFDGVACRAALDEPSRGNAIHGLVRWLPWVLQDRTPHAVDLSCALHPQPGYAWTLDLAVRYELGPFGLRVTMRATNRSATPAPFGAGAHPYVSAGTELIDDATLRVPARRRIIADERQLPTDEVDVAGTEFDFTEGRVLGDLALDTGYTALQRDEDGIAEVQLSTHDQLTTIKVWMDEAFPWVMIYTGDTVEPASRRRRGLAIEPMTCPPNALRSGVDLVTLAPRATWTGTWGIRALLYVF